MSHGKPFNIRPRNGGGKFNGAWPGRGIATNCASRANSFASRQFLELCRTVRANEMEQFPLSENVARNHARFNRVGNSAAPEFLFINFTIRFARKRQPEQTHPLCRAVGLVSGLNGDCAAGIKTAGPTQFFNRRLRGEQMTEVNRVERTAK